jgi:hypothetical protein
MLLKGKMQQKVRVPGRVSTLRKCLRTSIDVVTCTNSDCTKNIVQADDPEESVDPAGLNEIMKDIHVAETRMRSREMHTRSGGKNHYGSGEQLSGCGQENSCELISPRGLAGKRPTFVGWEGS